MFVWSTFWMSTTAPTVLWGPISFVLIGGHARRLVRALSFRPQSRGPAGTGLDERQQQLRDRAWILSYQVLATVVVSSVGTWASRSSSSAPGQIDADS